MLITELYTKVKNFKETINQTSNPSLFWINDPLDYDESSFVAFKGQGEYFEPL